MAKEIHITDPKIMAVFEKMIAKEPGVAAKGKTMPYLSMNGNMYASISKADVIGVRLSKPDLAEFLQIYENGLYEGWPGFFQTEYVAVPNNMHSDMDLLQSWFAKCHAHALTLKPNKTTR